jgi:signal transduction histidine kinase
VSHPGPGVDPERVLILTRGGRDGELTREILAETGIVAEIVADIPELCAAIRDGAGAALLSEERLQPAAVRALVELLSEQPPWSDFPMVIFGATLTGERSSDAMQLVAALGNVTVLDRPVRVRSVVAATHAALRSRRRQYEARRAIAARDQFLAMLGHELRNPLGALRLATDLLKRGGPTQLPRHQATIDRQVRTLTRMVDDLLDVARVTTGKVVLRPEDVDLVEIVRAGLQQQEAAAREQGLEMRLDVRDEPLALHGDRVRLEQVLANLLGNAIKYTPAGGRVQVTLAREGERAALRVADTGVGIAPEMQERIFDVFAQVDGSLGRSQGGMGLGLPVVRSLVQMHDGTVRVRSEGPGQGSEFEVLLPLAARARAGTAHALEETGAVSPRRIVIVEDNDDIRSTEASLLALASHEVVTAGDGPEGVNTILRAHPDVAFVDLGLPGFDGLEVARRVRRSLGEAILLVAVSGYGQPEDRVAVLDAGFDRHLVKPVGLTELEAAMRPG